MRAVTGRAEGPAPSTFRRLVLLAIVALLCTSCGGRATTGETTTVRVAPPPAGLRVGVVGPLRLDVQGVVPVRGTLAQVGGARLVLVAPGAAAPTAVARTARNHPVSHFALVGASTEGNRAANLAGLVIDDRQAALLAGVVAGIAVADAGGVSPRIAWVGPQEPRLADAFAQGAHRALPGIPVLRQWSSAVPARCKEAALTALQRGATLLMAHGGVCADAVVAAAHQQNVPGLRVGDFELPGVAAGLAARDAVTGTFHGGEDVVYGASSGAVGIRVLDPRISPAAAARAQAAAQELQRTGAPAG